MDFGSVSGEAFRKSQPDIPFSLSVVLPLFLFFFTFSGRWCVALSVTDTQLRDSMIDKRQQPTSPERTLVSLVFVRSLSSLNLDVYNKNLRRKT